MIGSCLHFYPDPDLRFASYLLIKSSNRELQGSMAELEKLSREKIGAHFYVPSSVRQGHKKVISIYICFTKNLLVPDLKCLLTGIHLIYYVSDAEGTAVCG